MAKTAEKQRTRGRPFAPGVSGNPRGRPKGALGKRTLLMRQLEASDPVDLMKAQTQIQDALARHFGKRKMLSIQDAQVAVKVLVAMSDQMCALAELSRRAQPSG